MTGLLTISIHVLDRFCSVVLYSVEISKCRKVRSPVVFDYLTCRRRYRRYLTSRMCLFLGEQMITGGIHSSFYQRIKKGETKKYKKLNIVLVSYKIIGIQL